MAELKKIYKNGIIEITLTFKGIEFKEIIGEWKNGVRKGNNNIRNQIIKYFSNDENIEGIKNALEICDLESDFEIEESLDLLSMFEEYIF